MSTACASSVFLLSYKSVVLNQSVCVFALGYLVIYKKKLPKWDKTFLVFMELFAISWPCNVEGT